MNADAEHPEPGSTKDETLARHQRIAEVLDGKRRMDWSDWAMVIYESQCLTPDGRRVALQAVDALQHTLRDDFLQRVEDWLAHMRAIGDPNLAPDSHPIFSLGLWPVNDVPWVYANLIRLAAHIQLFKLDNHNRSRRNLDNNRVRRVLKTLRENPEPINWVSALLQLEVAGLGLRAGWDIRFEPPLGNGRYADVCLTNGPTQLLVETTLMRLSEADRKTLTLSHHLSLHLFNIEWQYDVRISGSLSSASLKSAEDRAQCLQDIEEAARATTQDGFSRKVSGPGEVLLTVFRPTEATAHERWEVVGDPIGERLLDRVIAILQDKNEQAKESTTPIWVRIDEHAGLWELIRSQRMTLAQTLNFLAGVLQESLASCSHLAGVILSPGVLWTGNAPPESFVERVEQNGSIALRCPIPAHHAREIIIVPQAGVSRTDTKVFADWYAHENMWLDWVLKQLQYPPFNALVHEPLAESDL